MNQFKKHTHLIDVLGNLQTSYKSNSTFIRMSIAHILRVLTQPIPMQSHVAPTYHTTSYAGTTSLTHDLKHLATRRPT